MLLGRLLLVLVVLPLSSLSKLSKLATESRREGSLAALAEAHMPTAEESACADGCCTEDDEG